MKQISNLLGVPVFLSGPHSESELVTTDLYSFGFYHPDFPVRLRRYFIPAVRDHAFRSITQRIYDNSIKKTARTFFSVYHKLASNPEFFAKETSRYSNLVVSKRLEPFYLYKFILFMQPGFTDGEDVDNSAKFRAHKNDDLFDELLVKQVIGFWMRRRIDGTEKSFLNGLHDLLEIYDLEFYKERLK